MTDVDPTTDQALARRSDEWLTAGLRCEPADRDAAVRAVTDAYRAAGLAQPHAVVWLGSPYAGALAAAMLHTDGTDPIDHDGAAAIRAALTAQGADAVSPGRSVRSQVRTAPWAAARARLLAQAGPTGFARHWAATAQRPWRQLTDQLVTPLRTRLDTHFGDADGAVAAAARGALLDAVHGQHDAAWLPAFVDVPGDGPTPDSRPAPGAGTAHGDGPATAVDALARAAVTTGWWWAYERLVILTERPVRLYRDNLGRLHHGDGPALAYPDGFAVHAWRGMPIPSGVAAELPTLTAQRIRTETNAEIRRVMMEHFGFDRYLSESDAERLDRDEFGTLWRVRQPDDEDLVMVEVVNATPEPDGSTRTYFLRVPPRTRTSREAVAWTFGLSAEEYAPLAQT